MAELKFTIPEGKAAEYISDYVYIHKNTETKDNPEYVSPEETPDVKSQIPKYTDSEWVREHILRYIRSQILRGKRAKYRDAEADSNVDDVE